MNLPYAVRRTARVGLSNKADEALLWSRPVDQGALHSLRNISN